MKIRVLVVEDDPTYQYEFREEIQEKLDESLGFLYATNLKDAIKIIDSSFIHFLVMDIIFPVDCKSHRLDYRAGLKLLDYCQQKSFSGKILVLSSQDKTFAVDLLIRYRQVNDYIFKDSSWTEIRHKILRQVEEISQKEAMKTEILSIHAFVGDSFAMNSIRSLCQKVAQLDTTVFLNGESGVGKEVVARYIHAVSIRSHAPFIALNCAAIPEHLFESYLFGHKKGAFTGAQEDSPGSFLSADGGTIFLDEIAELPLALQAKLLRVLQEKQILRLGDSHPRKVDVRVIAATNKNLEKSVKKGEFREDLFYRIHVFPISVPPLRERKEDIPLLVSHFLASFYQKTGIECEMDEKGLELLCNCDWPGNIRELKNTVERMAILCDHKKIGYEDILKLLIPSNRVVCTSASDYSVSFPFTVKDYKEAKQGIMDAFHREFLSYHLHKNGWQIAKTADSIGYNRNDLSQIVKKLNLEKPSEIDI